MPNLYDHIHNGEIGLLIMDNVSKIKSGIKKLNEDNEINFGNKYIKKHENSIEYNLHLMALFHDESRNYSKNYNQLFYRGANNLLHYNELLEPYLNSNSNSLKKFKDTLIEPKKLISIIENYLAFQKENANLLVHGDWKLDNIENGHLVDYAMVGRGFETDEIAYFLSDPNFRGNNFNLIETYKKSLNEYDKYRGYLNPEFNGEVISFNKIRNNYMMSSLLSQLVLRHSVMNKRNLNLEEKFQEREYFKYHIDTLLKTPSRFI